MICADEVNTHSGSTVMPGNWPGQVAARSTIMPTKTGHALVAVLEKKVRATRVTKYIIRVGPVVLAALEGIHRSGAAGG